MLAGPTETPGTNEGSQGALGALSVILPALKPSVQTKPVLLSMNSPQPHPGARWQRMTKSNGQQMQGRCWSQNMQTPRASSPVGISCPPCHLAQQPAASPPRQEAAGTVMSPSPAPPAPQRMPGRGGHTKAGSRTKPPGSARAPRDQLCPLAALSLLCQLHLNAPPCPKAILSFI